MPTKLQHHRAFTRNENGAVAIIFALAAMPIITLAGGTADYVLMTRDTAQLQVVFDAAAMAAMRDAQLGKVAVELRASNHVRAHLDSRLSAYPISISASATGDMIEIKTDGAKMRTHFLGLIGLNTIDVVARTKAMSTFVETITQNKPVTAQLDPEAGDYNRMYVYCYDDSRRNFADRGRSQMTAIADNAGTTYNFTMPSCKPNETFSYRLYNVRNARTQPWLWDTALPGTLIANNALDWANPWGNNAAYNYYSDTRMSGGMMTHQFENGVPILETVICENLNQCKPRTNGGILPSGSNRTPQQANKACAPGRFIYFGWEDRPPGYGWTDSDYDDIRVIVECPSTTTTRTTVVRLLE